MNRTVSFSPRQRDWWVISNPHSGGKGKGLKDVLSVLRQSNIATRNFETHSEGEGRSIAKKARNKRIVVAVLGGDGTVNPIASELVGGKAWLGVLPGGTSMALCHEAGISIKPRKAAEQLLQAKPILWDVGYISGRCFLVVAGVGFDAILCSRVTGFSKKHLGISAYYLGSILMLFEKPRLFGATWGKNKVENLHQIFFYNCSHQGIGMAIIPGANPFDGWLRMAALPWGGYLSRVTQGLASLEILKPFFPMDKISLKGKTKRAIIHTKGKIFVQVDGEAFVAENPMVHIKHKALWLLQPNRRNIS